MDAPIRKARSKTSAGIAHEWDLIAAERDKQVRSGTDVSYTKILIPTISILTRDADWSHVIDVGCGTGVLTEVLARTAKNVVGVDISKKSIAIAESSSRRPSNVRYDACSIERYSAKYTGQHFGLAVGNMLLQDVRRLSSVLVAITRILSTNGRLVLTLTHPWFWPFYWGYANKKWFRYGSEISIEAAFRISREEKPLGITTHFHRPLSQYFLALSKAGFSIDVLMEPMPSKRIQDLYPKRWRYPRFLAISCTKNKG